jgi:hypothetical protein
LDSSFKTCYVSVVVLSVDTIVSFFAITLVLVETSGGY